VEGIDPLVLDLAQLRTFTAGDAALEREIATLFATTAAEYLAAMVPAGPDRAWQEAAHTLKGSARSVGAARLAGLAAEAEALVGGEADPAQRNAVHARMEYALAEVVAAFHRLTEAGAG